MHADKLQKRHINQKLTRDIKAKLQNINSLNVYFDIKLNSTILSENGIIYEMKLNNNEINWKISKKLMFGSLVCLSSDLYAKSCLVGVIIERSIDKLKEGLIYIKFNFDIHYSVESNSLPQSNESYTMIETTAYFESYKYVLEALVWFNNSNHDEFPFNTKISKPKYLENACIDFRY